MTSSLDLQKQHWGQNKGREKVWSKEGEKVGSEEGEKVGTKERERTQVL